MSSPFCHISRLRPLIDPDVWSSRQESYDWSSLLYDSCSLAIMSSHWSDRISCCFGFGRSPVRLWSVSFDREVLGSVLYPLVRDAQPNRLIYDSWYVGYMVSSMVAGVRDIDGDWEYPPLEAEHCVVRSSSFYMDPYVRVFRAGDFRHPGDSYLTDSVLSCRAYEGPQGSRPEFPWEDPRHPLEVATAAVLASSGPA